MATVPKHVESAEVHYIESDGKPMGETQQHILNIRYALEPLEVWFAADPLVFVAGNLFLHYEDGDGRQHVSPDIFVARDVPKEPPRRKYLMRREGRGRTWSSSSRRPQRRKKTARPR